MKKEAIYFISGTMCNELLWQYIFPEIQKFTPIHIDISLANSFQDIDTIIASKITEPSYIVGFSLGGYAAMNFAIKHSDLIKKIVVIATDFSGLKADEITLRKSTISFLQKHQYKGISSSRIQQFLHPKNHDNTVIIAIIKKMDNELGLATLLRQLEATSQRASLFSLFSTFKKKTLLIGSTNDNIVPITALEEAKHTIVDSSLFVFTNSGHMIPLEQPVKTAALLQHFFS